MKSSSHLYRSVIQFKYSLKILTHLFMSGLFLGSVATVQSQELKHENMDPPISFYGFVLSNALTSTNATDSFGNANLSAPTAAHRPTTSQDKYSRTSFQVAQSRIGVQIFPQRKTRGKLEFDFIDFTKATPTTGAQPRLRIAKIEYIHDEKNLFFMGQDWDIFSPLSAHTYNPVGNNFQAGNVGFMRDQLGWIYKQSSFEYAVALGLAGSNNTSSDTNLEFSKVPTLAARITKALPLSSKVGISALGTRITFNSELEEQRHVWGLNTFAETSPSPCFNLRAEAYLGTNLSSIGALAIGQGRASASMKEAGGYASLRLKLAENTALFGGSGLAQILNGSDVATPSGTTTGIRSNKLFRLGFDHKLTDQLTIFTEGTHFRTSYQDTGLATSTVIALGGQLVF